MCHYPPVPPTPKVVQITQMSSTRWIELEEATSQSASAPSGTSTGILEVHLVAAADVFFGLAFLKRGPTLRMVAW